MNLNHVHIGTKDLKKSIDFYCLLFGFKTKFNHDPGVFLSNDAGFLIAIDPVDEILKFPAWFHLGFCLNSEAEVQSIYQKAKELKVKIARDLMTEKDQFASFFILDPDGYKIEVSWHNE
ncbi:MAG: VOC family protein [Bdellovibrionaceae bacterium]|nr:VOC family protein [Pseudobdellovibrionaceae bacterium]